ncbi:hypothetical protein HRbin09_02123 [bacterium HR09]|nr:hypothetical protein HRbin09_02123 [bacterium HR09]
MRWGFLASSCRGVLPFGSRSGEKGRRAQRAGGGGGADSHRSGLRVRLLGRAGGAGPQGRRFAGGAGELQPRHHHDRSGAGRCHLRGAHYPGNRGANPGTGAVRRFAPHPGRTNRPQRGGGAGQKRGAGPTGGASLRGLPFRHSNRRGPGAFPGGHAPGGFAGLAFGDRPFAGGRGEGPGAGGAAGHPSPILHPWRARGSRGLQPRRVCRGFAASLSRFAGGRSAHGALGGGLEGVRAGGHAGLGRHRGGGVLH